jgi:subfamily B ATP-binding cassette protein HlyB/CyaB
MEQEEDGLDAESEARQSHADTPKSLDPGLTCLVMLARFHGVAAEPAQLAHEFGEGGPFGVTQILLAAAKLGLKAKAVRAASTRLATTPLPALALGRQGGFFILARIDEDQALIHDPRVGKPQTLSRAELEARWTGELDPVHLARLPGRRAGASTSPGSSPPSSNTASCWARSCWSPSCCNLFALVTPLFFQVVMDKVLVHRGLTTLDVIAVGLLVVSLFEVVLSGLRTYVFAHTTSRIDVELGARLFRHLLSLPMAYFQARRVGDSVARVRELENIRAFLTGNAITVVLDVFFSGVFIAVMLFYSGWLTLVVLASLPSTC